MARPKLGNRPISLRLTPAVDAALADIARSRPSERPSNPSHDPIGPVAVEAFCWFLGCEGELAHGIEPELSVDWAEHEELVEAAVLSISTEPRSTTRSFVAPVTVIDALDTLLARVDAWPRYQTKIKWDSHAGEYVLVHRNTPPRSSLVQWAAIIEWLSARGSASRYASAGSERAAELPELVEKQAARVAAELERQQQHDETKRALDLRNAEIVRARRRGLTYKAIAEEFVLSVQTIVRVCSKLRDADERVEDPAA